MQVSVAVIQRPRFAKPADIPGFIVARHKDSDTPGPEEFGHVMEELYRKSDMLNYSKRDYTIIRTFG
jgi:hypothetical protein